ncbi:hypothetical protein [Thalassotalea ganghwensis]
MSVVSTAINHWINTKFEKWLAKQLPASSKQTLKRNNIFILPTRFGYAYLFFATLMFILGTNYQNNLIILVSFILASCFVTAMIQSYRNLAHLQLALNNSLVTGFCDEKLFLPINLKSAGKKFKLFFSLSKNAMVCVDLINEQAEVMVPLMYQQRGIHRLPRVIVSTIYPFGLFKVWTQLNFGVSALIYPKPIKPPGDFVNAFLSNESRDASDTNKQQIVTEREGIDDFAELKRYQRGESLAKVAWKQVAKGQDWHTKHYVHAIDASPDWLSLEMFPSAHIESRLSWLTFLVLTLEKQEIPFGLMLNNEKISPDGGKLHFQRCLKMIATYGQHHG